MNIQPRQKGIVIGATLLSAVFILAAWLISSDGGEAAVAQPSNINVELSNNLSQAVAEADTDGDGLKDWEEALWGSDPNDSDTDGDGTPDGEEIAQRRNPTIAGPDDKRADPNDSGIFEKLDTDSGDLTLTSKLARQFFTQYLQAHQSGRTLGPISQQQLLTSVIGSAVAEQDIRLPSHSIAELTLTDNQSSEALRTYGNRLGEAIARHSFQTENEIIIMRRAIDNQDPDEIEKLRRIAAGFNGIAQDYLGTPVPKDAARVHLELINQTAALSAVIDGMGGVLDDPLRALLYFEQYDTVSASTIEAVEALKTYFVEHDVIFTSDEPGFVFQET